jgi:cysteine desulfurase
VTEKTGLVSVMFANNEIGTVQPIQELCGIAHERGALFHTDAVQAVGHVPINVANLGVDLLSASAHKFNGPKGVGFLYVREGTKIAPYAAGGSQERGLRAGTENIAGIVAMAAALQKNVDRAIDVAARLQRLEDTFLTRLSQVGIDYIRNGGSTRLPGNVNISIKDADGEMLLHRLDLMGICISTGSACDSVNTQISHVIQAIKVPQEYAQGTIRITFGAENTEDDALTIADALAKILVS